MKLSSKIRSLLLWAMLTIIAVAYTGKILHTHSADYYDSLHTTKSAASNGMSDNCPICHFTLMLFFFNQSNAFTSFTVLISVIAVAKVIFRTAIAYNNSTLRAPPVLL